MPGRRMNDNTGGFVEDDDPGVLKNNRKRNFLGNKLQRGWLGNHERYLIPRFQKVARFCRGIINLN